MRRLTIVVTLALTSGFAARSIDADEPGPRDRAEKEAKRVTWAFSDGVAPDPEAGREARRVLESYVSGLPDAERRRTRLVAEAIDPLLAKAAWAAGDLAGAKQRAETVLAAATKSPEDWDRGNILHEMNVLLGRVALEREDLAEATRRLLEAGATPGSPQLDTFGPDWTLARDLLARGERKTVLAYVDRVGKFWEQGRDRLATWKKTLEEGGTPEFVPKRGERGQAKEPAVPPPEPPSEGPAKSIVGLWESTNRSGGGIGNAIEFRADGRVLTRLLMTGDLRYRVESDRLVFGDGEAESIPLGKFDGDTWTVAGLDGTTVPKKRVGVAAPGAPPVVGTWTYSYLSMSPAFERYRPDGWFSMRVLMPGLSSGKYSMTGAEVRLTFAEGSQDFTATVTGDRLRLVSKEPNKDREYRYAGEKPWYDLGAP